MTLYPTDGGPPRPIPGVKLHEEPLAWIRDGTGLYVVRPGSVPAPVDRVTIATGERTLWREVIPGDRAGVTRIRNIRIVDDGAIYAYSYTRVLSSDLYLVHGLIER